MKKTLLRASSLTFAVVVTAFLVARAAGCSSASTPAVDPPATTPAPAPAPATAPALAPAPVPDAGPTLSIVAPSSPGFMPATKAAMPIFREPPAVPQQATPP